MIRTRSWSDLRWPEFKTLPANTVAVLPVASTEQHGPHLPVSVDCTINRGVVERTLEVIPADLPVLVLPMQPVALAVEHLRFPGTLTTKAETLIGLVCDIGASVARAGVKRLVIVNSHGGNVAALDVAARRIRIESDIFCVNAMWARMGKPESLRDPVESRFGIHAGRDETSLLLRLSPQNVDMSAARNFVSRWQGASNIAPRVAPDGGAPLARIHSECFTGDLLGSLRCDCGPQLRGAIRKMAEDGAGVLLYLAQEGRGIGLVNKLRAYTLQDQGLDTLDANRALGYGADERGFLVAATMLRELGVTRVRLLTNNPDKLAGLAACGIEVMAREVHKFTGNGVNDRYLQTKAERFGHLLG